MSGAPKIRRITMPGDPPQATAPTKPKTYGTVIQFGLAKQRLRGVKATRGACDSIYQDPSA